MDSFRSLGAWLSGWLPGPLGAEFVICYRPGARVRIQGRVPASKVGAITAFFAHDLQPAGRVTVRGTRGPGRALRLQIAGPLSAGECQCVRNVLIDLLG